MKIKDIVNRDIVNLTNCEQEPIHIPGSIQPHGFLLGLSTTSFTIEFCSGNTLEYIGIDYHQLLSKSFAAVFGEDALAVVKQQTTLTDPSIPEITSLILLDKRFECTLHVSNDMLLVEGEPASIAKKEIADVYAQTKRFLAYMEETKSLKELCQSVAEGTREITGYDRVMVYRFDAEYNGEVFAESCREDLEPFLGLHYPHTDIPPQARDLYIRNLLRLIVDIDYKPVPLYTIDDVPGKNLDLSISILRSTSPIHVQYLQNMGVGATLTISLLYKGKLWGLIACHHYSKKNLTHEVRVAAKLQGHFITSQIDTRQLNEAYDIARNCNEALEKAQAESFGGEEKSLQEIISNPDLLKVCNATGVAMFVDNTLYASGQTPAKDDIIMLANWLLVAETNQTLETSNLSSLLEEAKRFCDCASGVLFYKTGFENEDCILWFRPQTVQEVNWAGDPAKAIVKDKNGLSPRNSFKLWKEIVECKSKPWRQEEINAAANYTHALEKHLSLLRITEEERKYRQLSQLLKETNAELENINWISTHDLQEPLRKIQMMASRILNVEDNQPANDVLEKVIKINSSANRMQTLLKDILKYTRIKNVADALAPVKPNDILNDLLPDIEEPISRIDGELKVNELPQINGVSFLLKQLFSNLILNSVKFHSPARKLLIEISAGGKPQKFAGDETGRLFNEIIFKDNGIGFEQQFAESIFNVFTRLHNQTEYEGSGIGLALCKKIMQSHKGYITANGTPGGATFHLFFPVMSNVQ